MGFGTIPYQVIIYPVEQILQLAFTFLYRIFDNYGLAVLGLSVVVTFLCFPLYHIAETWQEHERLLQKKMKPSIERIKKTFRGDERFMILLLRSFSIGL